MPQVEVGVRSFMIAFDDVQLTEPREPYELHSTIVVFFPLFSQPFEKETASYSTESVSFTCYSFLQTVIKTRFHRSRYGSPGEAQGAVANRCCVALWEATFGASLDGPAPMFLFCPTEYCGRIAQVRVGARARLCRTVGRFRSFLLETLIRFRGTAGGRPAVA